MYASGLDFDLHKQAGIFAPTTDFARMHINGYFLRYMMVFYRSMAKTGVPLMNQRCWHQSYEYVGDLFKSKGSPFNTTKTDTTEGPWGWGDVRPLPANCKGSCDPSLCPNGQWTDLDRYSYTYDRQTNGWGNAQGVKDLIETNYPIIYGVLNQSEARAALDAKLDMNLYLTDFVFLNWAQTWVSS